MTPGAEIEPGPHWWRASALTTICFQIYYFFIIIIADKKIRKALTGVLARTVGHEVPGVMV